MSKIHISNNSLKNFIFSAGWNTTLRRRILKVSAFWGAQEFTSLEPPNFRWLLPCCLLYLLHFSLLLCIQPSPLPMGGDTSPFICFAFHTPILLPHSHSFFSLHYDLLFLNLTCFIDVILHLKKPTKIIQPVSIPLASLRYRQRKKENEKERKKKIAEDRIWKKEMTIAAIIKCLQCARYFLSIRRTILISYPQV